MTKMTITLNMLHSKYLLHCSGLLMEKYKEYYTSREAAKILSVAVSTVQLWTKKGSLNSKTTAGGHRRISRESLESMLLEQSHSKKTVLGQNALSILVVENNPQMARLYQKSIESWQENVDLSVDNNGYDALISVGIKKPDVIITDLLMPEMDGFQMLKSISSQPELQASHIIVVTGLSNDEIATFGELPVNTHVFIKPIDFIALHKYLKFELALFNE